MNKWMIVGMGCLLFATVVGAVEKSDYRAFTAKDGRAIEAKIIKYDTLTGKTTFQLRNGRKSTAGLSMFCEADQIIIKDWYLSRELFSPSKLVVKIAKKTITSDRYHEKREGWQSHYPGMDFEDVAFDVKIDNRSNVDLKNLVVDYCVFYASKRKEFSGTSELQEWGDGSAWVSTSKKDLGTKTVPLKRRGDFAIKTLLSKKSVQHLSEEVQIREGTEASYGASQGKTRTYRIREVEDKISGIIIRVSIPLSSGGFARKEYSYPSKFLDKETVDWNEKPAQKMSPSEGDSSSVMLGKARELCLNKKYKEAIILYEKICQAEPRNTRASWGLGKLYLEADNPERNTELGVEWLKKTAQLGVNGANGDLAKFYATDPDPTVRDPKKAMEYATRYIAKFDDPSPGAYDTMGCAYARNGQYQLAAETMEKAIAAMEKRRGAALSPSHEYRKKLEQFRCGQAWPSE